MGEERRLRRELQHTKKKLHEREMRRFADMTPEQIMKHIQYVNAKYRPNKETNGSVEATDGQQD